MREALRSVEQKDLLQRIDCALHDLCQPLTVLQCRLALGEMIDEPDAMREAIHEALQECMRLNQAVDTIRTMLREITADQEKEERW